MDGKYKIAIILIFIICSCKNEVKMNNKNGLNTDSQRVFIAQNINSLIDSVESFDTSLIPPSEEFKDFKVEKITIGLLDSVFIENDENFNINQKKNQLKSFKFKLQESDLVNFKTNYTIKLVKVNNYDTNVLFVNFFNFKIQGNKASIEVKKKIGISMIHHKYNFEKENGVWILKRKELLGMG